MRRQTVMTRLRQGGQVANMSQELTFEVRFYSLSADLQPYFTHLYAFDIDCGESGFIEDLLHPEWAGMRFTVGEPPAANVGAGKMQRQWPATISGPTTRPIHFRIFTSRIWGLGLQPAGWARFVDGNACDFANRIFDGATEPAFRAIAPLLDIASDGSLDTDGTAGAIDDYLRTLLYRPSPNEAQVIACHQALNDPAVASVGEMRERLGIGARSLERLCARYFGFPPKQVLRRQRFLRSLAVYMLSEGRTWSDAMDAQYYDQAQFVRDFRSFMGMTPSEYAAKPHPIIDRIIAQRMADQGALPKADLPTLLRLSQKADPKAG